MAKPIHTSENDWGCCNALPQIGLFGRNHLAATPAIHQPGIQAKKDHTGFEAEGVNLPASKVCRCTSQKWKAQGEVNQVISRLQHQDVVSRVQAGRRGLGWGEAPRL